MPSLSCMVLIEICLHDHLPGFFFWPSYSNIFTVVFSYQFLGPITWKSFKACELHYLFFSNSSFHSSCSQYLLRLQGLEIFILGIILICKFLWGCILRLPPASIFIETPYLDDWQVHTSHSPEILLNPTGSQPRNRRPQGTLL